jgi:hypothetical protein
MVHVVPPPGWTPKPPAAQEPAPSGAAGPPPLDRVAANPLTIDLGSTGTSWFGESFRYKLLAAVILTTVLVSVCLLCWRWTHPAAPEPAAVEAEQPARADDARPSSPGPRSAGVGAPAKSPTTSPPSKRPPATPSTVPPKPPPEVKPAKPDTPPVVKETPKDPAKEAVKQLVKREAKQPDVKKLPPAPMDVAARMADPLPGIELTDVPLVRAFDLLATVSALPITLDPDAMRLLGVAPRDRISLRLGPTTIGQALRAAAGERGLAVTVDNGQVIVTTPTEFRETLRTIPYTVSDLTGDDKAAVAELAALARKLVAPESWQGAAGRGTIEPSQGVLIVSQTRDIHQQVLVFCEKLRNARRKPLRSRDKPERFTLATRTSQARAMLDQPVTANFHEPAALAKILSFLATATGSDILIDHAALAAAETSGGVETSLTVQKQPLGAVLADLLRPLGLTYRVIGPNAIQVTTGEAAEEHLELEFYPVGPQLSGGTSAAKLVERLKTTAAASTWSDAGGSGDIYFDAPSQHLIVLQSQPVQTAIERLLAANANGGKSD